MAKLNKLHKRHLVLKFGITFSSDKDLRACKTDEEMTLECDIPRRWSNKEILDFAFSHINRRGQTTESRKNFRVKELTSVTVVFPDDDNRELKLYSHDPSRDS